MEQTSKLLTDGEIWFVLAPLTLRFCVEDVGKNVSLIANAIDCFVIKVSRFNRSLWDGDLSLHNFETIFSTSLTRGFSVCNQDEPQSFMYLKTSR